MVSTNDIPDNLTINIDQTPFPFVLISMYTKDKTNKKFVPISDSADYCWITGTISVTASGKFLPIQLIYHGKQTDVTLNSSFQRVPRYPQKKSLVKWKGSNWVGQSYYYTLCLARARFSHNKGCFGFGCFQSILDRCHKENHVRQQ